MRSSQGVSPSQLVLHILLTLHMADPRQPPVQPLEQCSGSQGAYFSSFLSCAFAFLCGFFSAGAGSAALTSAFFCVLAAGLGAAVLAGAGAGLAFLPSCSSAALAFLFFSYTA